MTQEERWLAKYNEVMGFIENNHRNPSRHRIEEHDMLNWVKTDDRGRVPVRIDERPSFVYSLMY